MSNAQIQRGRPVQVTAAPAASPATPLPTLSECIEYEHTSRLDAPDMPLKPEPPPGNGWRLVAMAYGNGRLHYAWARKVGT